MHIRANSAYLEIFGYESFEEIEGLSVLDLIAPTHTERFKQLLKDLSKGEHPPKSLHLDARSGDGSTFEAELEFAQASYEGEPCLQIILRQRSEEHTSELQSLMRISYDVFCLKKKHNTAWQQQ